MVIFRFSEVYLKQVRIMRIIGTVTVLLLHIFAVEFISFWIGTYEYQSFY